jgi:hypothetical protein
MKSIGVEVFKVLGTPTLDCYFWGWPQQPMGPIALVVFSPGTEVVIGCSGDFIEQVWLTSPNLTIVTTALNYRELG